eukprot:836597-Alexandrium_andersonii.AAC.1
MSVAQLLGAEGVKSPESLGSRSVGERHGGAEAVSLKLNDSSGNEDRLEVSGSGGGGGGVRF